MADTLTSRTYAIDEETLSALTAAGTTVLGRLKGDERPGAAELIDRLERAVRVSHEIRGREPRQACPHCGTQYHTPTEAYRCSEVCRQRAQSAGGNS